MGDQEKQAMREQEEHVGNWAEEQRQKEAERQI